MITRLLSPRRATAARTAPAAPQAPEQVGIRMVAIDIDGTLLRSDKRMSIRVRDAIIETSRRGVKVVIATARPPRSVREIYDLLKLDTPLINYNGALTHDPIRRKTIHHQPIDRSLSRAVVKLARKIDPKVVVSLEILDKWYTDHVDESLPTETSMRFNPDFIGPLDAFLHVPITKLMLLASADRLMPIREALDQKFRGRLAAAISDSHLLQLIHPLANKGIALAHVADEFGIHSRNVMAIGDAPNDVGMLTWAGLGVAVGNAWERTLAAADVVVPANDEDGVAYALDKYVLSA
jgi:Cof subfamily protein (haloacid dehalogenase superfamily)